MYHFTDHCNSNIAFCIVSVPKIKGMFHKLGLFLSAGAWWGMSAELGVIELQDGSSMTGTDLCVNKPHCAAAVRP